MRAAGADGFLIQADVSQPDDIRHLFTTVQAEFGTLDIFVSNARPEVASFFYPPLEITLEQWDTAIDSQAKAFLVAAREAARLMLPHDHGAIFFTGATASLRGGAGYAAFAAAKAGLRAVAQSAARELGPKNIHVAHLVIDAGVDTEWVRDRIKEREGEAALANLEPGRLMRPESVAEAYWQIYQEPRDAWSFEREIRPFAETW